MRQKITLEDCKQHATNKGGECLSTEYKNTSIKMEWKCSEGHKWFATFGHIKHGDTWCPACANKVLSIEDCREFAENKGGYCLSSEYKNNQTPMVWKCSKGHEWSTKFCNIRNGYWCSICSGKAKHTLEDCQEFAINKGGLCLSTEYKNSKVPMLWRCSEGHEWSTRFGHIKHDDTWCPFCLDKRVLKYSIEDCQKYAKERNGECLSSKYVNGQEKMKWRCSEGHEWFTKFYHMTHYNTWCSICSGKAKLSLEECQEHAKKQGGECLSTEYINSNTKMEWKCSNGHTWYCNFTYIKNKNSWCPNCKYKSESACRDLLEELTGEKFPKTRTKWLSGLELDGFSERLNLGFEYNGEQHYKVVPCFHKNGIRDLEVQQKRDVKKIHLCKENGIKLIIIPYEYTHTELEKLRKFLIEELERLDFLVLY